MSVLCMEWTIIFLFANLQIEMIKPEPASKLLCWTPILAALFLLLHHGAAARCGTDIPTVRQTQVGFGDPPKFTVVIQNSCQMCPTIGLRLRCPGFPQRLASPRVLRVVGYGDCVVNGGLPLGPLQTISFSYTHQRFRLSPRSWYYQCE